MLRFDSLRRVFGLFCLATLLAGAAGESPTVTPSPSVRAPVTVETLRKQRASLAQQIERLSASAKDKVGDAAAEEQLTLARALDALYAQHLGRLEQRRQLEAQVADAERTLKQLDKFEPDEPKPYSFLLLENLRDQLAAEEDREEAIDADTKSAKQQLSTSHKALDEQAAATKPAKQQAPAASPSADVAQLAGAIARQRIAVKQTEVEIEELRSTLCTSKQKQLKQKIDVVKKDVKFSEHDLERSLARVAADEAELKRQRRTVERTLEALNDQHLATKADETKPSVGQASSDEQAESHRAAAEAYQSQIVLLDQQIASLADLRKLWKRRFELASAKPDGERLARWLDEADEFRDELKDRVRSLENRRDQARQTRAITAVAPTAADGKGEPASPRVTAVMGLRDLADAQLAQIEQQQRGLERFRDDLKDKLKNTPGNWAAAAKRFFTSILDFEVGGGDDEDGVTIGRLVVLLAYIVAGMMLAYLLSKLVARRFLPRLGVHRGTAVAVKSIVFYSLCVFFGILAFKLLNIPLAAFAFLGGAAAIAIGFGSQDIMNNFMSGIILLTEQPIRVGDVVELSGVQGIVSHIGLRSTRLRTDSNHELIIPNKTLLDEQVTNLTLSDNIVQTHVTATIEWKMKAEDARWQILSAVFAHPLVIKSPRPVALLTEFDPYYGTLAFDIYFSVQLTSFMQLSIVESEVLESISSIFPSADAKAAIEGTDKKEDDGEKSDTPAAPVNGINGQDLKKLAGAAMMRQLKRLRVPE